VRERGFKEDQNPIRHKGKGTYEPKGKAQRHGKSQRNGEGCNPSF